MADAEAFEEKYNYKRHNLIECRVLIAAIAKNREGLTESLALLSEHEKGLLYEALTRVRKEMDNG